MKKLALKFISLFCVISLFIFSGALTTTVMGLDNNIILAKNIHNIKGCNDYNVSLNVKVNDRNKNKDVILVVDENTIENSQLSMIKKQTLNFVNDFLGGKDCKLSIIGFSSEKDNVLVDFTSNKNILEKTINNITNEKLENSKVDILNLEKQLNKRDENTNKYVVFLTGSSTNEKLNTNDDYKNLINKYKNVNFMAINLNSESQKNKGENFIINSFTSSDKVYEVKSDDELKQSYEKIQNSILKGNRYYKNIVIEDEVPNNFEVVSCTINGEKTNPVLTNNRIIWKVDEIPSKGIDIEYTIKPKEGFTPKENIFDNINGKLVCDEITYGESKQVNEKNVQFEKCLVKSSEKVDKKELTQNNKALAQSNEQNLIAEKPKEAVTLANVTLQNDVQGASPYAYSNYMFSYEIKGKTQVFENFGGVFKDSNSTYTTQLPMGEYSLILSKPINFDFTQIELNGHKVSVQELKDGRLSFTVTESNPNINIKVITKKHGKPYFSNCNYLGTNIFPDPND